MDAKKSQWHAVEVQSSRTCCPAAQALKGKRFLSAEAPMLPLSDCTRPGACACAYKKYPDRRTETRREADTAILRPAVPSPDRRKKRGRRKTD